MLDFNLYGPEVKKPVLDNHTFQDEMRKQGIVPDCDIIADGKLHRFTVQGDKARSNNGWYVLHVDMDFSAGSFGSWRTGEQHTWCSRLQSEMTDAEREAYRKRMDELKRLREAEQARVQKECQDWCVKTWNSTPLADTEHQYLKRKGIGGYGLHVYKDSLMVPMYQGDSMSGMQFISPDGTKTFKTGSKLKGSMYLLPGKDKSVLCEGFATAASIQQATGYIVYIAFNAGNLVEIAKQFKFDFIAADNDHQTEGNPGLTKAQEAAKVCGAKVVYPTNIKGTDFNDLHCERGIEAVMGCFVEQQKKYGPDIRCANKLMQTEFEPVRWAIEGLLPEGLAVLSGPPKLGKSWLSLDFCLSIVTGGMAASQFPTEKGSVLLCAMEDNDRRLKSRLEMRTSAAMMMPLTGPLDFNKTDNPDLTGLYYTTNWKRLNDGGLQDISEFLDAHPDCKLIVLDTLAKVKPEAKKSGTAYEQDYNDMGALQRLAMDRHCCVLMITHNRKTETEDVVESISGSIGIPGVVDTIMILKRKRSSKQSSLYVTGRDISECTWKMQFDGDHGAWSVLGQEDEEKERDSDKKEILDALKRYSDETGRGAKPKDLFEFMGGDALAPKQNTIRQTLNRCYHDGILAVYKGAYMHKVT